MHLPSVNAALDLSFGGAETILQNRALLEANRMELPFCLQGWHRSERVLWEDSHKPSAIEAFVSAAEIVFDRMDGKYDFGRGADKRKPACHRRL